MNGMKLTRLICVVLAAGALAGCADGSSAPSDEHAGPITISPHSETDTPPPTLSGYVDSSYTAQTR